MPINIGIGIDTGSLESQLAELKRKSQEAGKAIGDGIGSGAKKAEKSADDAAKGLEDLGDAAGLPVDKLKKLAGGFAALANPATAAVVAVGAFAAGIGLAVAGIVSAVSASEELAAALKPLSKQEGFGITDKQLSSIQSANAAMGALGAILKQLVVSMGAEFAPAVEKAATLLVKLGLMALDAFNTFADGHDILRELARFMVGALIDSVTGVVSSLVDVASAMADLARAAGQDGLADSLSSVSARWSEFKSNLADRIIDELTGSITRLDGATGNYDERAKKLIGSMKSLGATTKQVKDAYAASIKAIDEDNAATEKARGLIDQLTASARKSFEERLTGEAAIRAALEDQLAALQSVYQQAILTATSDQQRAEATEKYEQARTEAVLSTEAKIREELKKTADEASKSAEDAAASQESAWTSAIGSLQGGLQGIITLIGGPVAGAIAGLVLSLEDVVAGLKTQLLDLFTAVNQVNDIKKAAAEADTAYEEQISSLKEALSEAVNDGDDERAADIQAEIAALREEQEAAAKAADKQIAAAKEAGGLLERIPYVISDLVISFVDTFVPMFVKTLPDIAKNFALALTSPEFLAAIAKIALYLISPWVQFAFWAKVGAQIFKGLWEAFMMGWRDFVSGQMFDDVKSAIVSGFEGAINSLREAWNDIIQGIRDVLSFKWAKGGGSVIGDLVTELVSLGTASTKTFGDAPSMQRAGPQGGRVQTSPGDYYLVGRNPQALLEQALDGVFGAGAAPVVGGGGQVINMSFQHRTFDSFFAYHARLGGQTSALFRQIRASKDARGM